MQDEDSPVAQAERMIARWQGERAGVQRDMEVIRAIIRHIEARTDVWPKRVQIEGLDDRVVQAHVWMLHREGMLNTKDPVHLMGEPTPRFEVRDLTWQGHDLAAVVSETSWQRLKAKFTVTEMGAMTLKGLVEVGGAMTIAWAKKQIGLPD